MLHPIPKIDKPNHDAWTTALVRLYRLEVSMARPENTTQIQYRFQELKALIETMSDVRDREYQPRRGPRE